MGFFWALFLLVLSLNFVVVGFSFAPWVPIRQRNLERVMRLITLRPGETFYDLGSGDGRVVLAVAQKYPQCQAWGIEFFLPLFLLSKIKKLLSGVKNADFQWKNLFQTDLSRADWIYLFGLPKKISRKLKGKMERELKPGTRVVCFVFGVEGWSPEIIEKKNPKDLPIFVYVKK